MRAGCRPRGGLATLIAGGYQVVTLGGRGVSRSQAPPPPYSVAEMAADTAELVEHLGAEPVRAVGLSLGGLDLPAGWRTGSARLVRLHSLDVRFDSSGQGRANALRMSYFAVLPEAT